MDEGYAPLGVLTKQGYERLRELFHVHTRKWHKMDVFTGKYRALKAMHVWMKKTLVNGSGVGWDKNANRFMAPDWWWRKNVPKVLVSTCFITGLHIVFYLMLAATC